MRRYEVQDVTVQREVALPAECDGCGVSEDGTDYMVEVVIDVNLGEEGGGRNELHYCNDCLLARCSTLVAAGSTAELVTGLPQGPVLTVDARRNLTGRLLELRDRWLADGMPGADELAALLEEVMGDDDP